MNEQIMELNLGKVIMAILKRYEMVEVSPDDLLADVSPDYKLRVDFNDSTEMFEISLSEPNES
jgi:hypothetical protein